MHLYSHAIMEHAQKPFCTQRIKEPSQTLTRSNPICGDRVCWEIQVENDTLIALGHQTRGCILCRASASILAQGVVAKSPAAILHHIDVFKNGMKRLIRSGDLSAMKEIQIFEGLATAPARKECVLLPWETLEVMLARMYNKDRSRRGNQE